MTSLHQLEHEFAFTTEELRYLQTTQRLAEDITKEWFAKLRNPDQDYIDVMEDVRAFRQQIQESVRTNTLTLPIKMGVVFWLNGVWNRMYNLFPKPLDFKEGDTVFTRQDIHRMHLMLYKDYIDYANGR
jgi:hypothetical protein